jgi:hypothetical protein
MKIPLVLALAALVIGFVLPVFAQQKDTVDPQLRQRLVALLKNYTDAMEEELCTLKQRLYRLKKIKLHLLAIC